MHFINSSFNINITKLSNNKILFSTKNLIIDYNLDLHKIITPILNNYKEISVEFINTNESCFNNFAIILEINKELLNNDIINPEENHLYYLNKYNKTIENADLLKYNVIGLAIIGLIVKEFLLSNYNIILFTHINSIKNIYDKISNYDTLINDINLYKQDKLPIVDPRGKQLMQKIINKSINSKQPISGSLETIIYNVPKGLGKPYFNLFESSLSGMMYLIPGLKSLEFANVYKINSNLENCYSDISFENDKIKYASNVYYGVESGITTGDIIRFSTHFLPPFLYNKTSTSINYKTLENIYVVKSKQEYFNLHQKIIFVEALTSLCIYNLLKG